MSEECRFCHCTETSACMTEDGPCYWRGPGYCSACASKHLDQLIDAACEWAKLRGFEDHPATLHGRAWHIATSDKGLIVFDHIGVPVFGVREDEWFIAPHYDAPDLLELFQKEQREAA